MYCTPIDLIAYANRARLIGQLASTDYGVIPTAEEVTDYFFNGTYTPENEQALRQLDARVEQAISGATGEINGYTALFPTITLPAETLKTACMDLALFRLFEKLDEHSIVKQNADKWIVFFDKIATGKAPINADESTHATGCAETAGSEVIFTADTLEGY